jgi:DNA-binding transcriptional ArsR family regulator
VSPAPPPSPADAVLQALGDPTRRRLVELLGEGPRSASELAGPLAVTLTAVSQHLRVLEGSGLIATQKQGRVRLCRLRPEGLDVLDAWVRERRSLWERRLERLEAVMRDG